jgi:hypothetical protein
MASAIENSKHHERRANHAPVNLPSDGKVTPRKRDAPETEE